MAAQPGDKFKKVGASTVTSLAAPGKAIGATSITVGSTTNYPLDTGVVVAIRVVDTAGALVSGTYTEWNAIVTSATSLTLDPTPAYGSDQVYAAGSSTQVYISVAANAHNQMVDGLLVAHDQDGTLKAGAVDNVAVLADDVVETAKIKDKAATLAKINGGTTAGVLTTDASGTVSSIPTTLVQWTGWSSSNFGTTETSLGTKQIVVPASCNTLVITGSVRIQNQDANNKDMAVYVRDANNTSNKTKELVITNNTTFAGVSGSLVGMLTVTGGTTITLDLRASCTTGSANSSNGCILVEARKI